MANSSNFNNINVQSQKSNTNYNTNHSVSWLKLFQPPVPQNIVLFDDDLFLFDGNDDFPTIFFFGVKAVNKFKLETFIFEIF